MTYLDARHEALTHWVAHKLENSTIELTPLGSDAGFRRYFRYETPSVWLAVDAPPATENTPIFLQIGDYLQQHGVRVPKIKAADATLGFLLVEDFGDALLSKVINTENADDLYKQGFTIIHKMNSQTKPEWLPEYDETLLRFEVSLFTEWFVKQLLGYSPSADEQELVDKALDILVKSALEQPQQFVHRDFHCRNLLVTPDQELAVIDFQGGLWGPYTYDAVSLLKDCYKRWPAERVTRLATEFYENSPTLSGHISKDTFMRWFDWMGLQRHIKVLGIFARLHLRDNKPHYLQDLSLVIRYTLEACDAYPELKPFAGWFQEKLLPLAEQHDWYIDYYTAGED